jgi:hypothetical protein
VGCPVSHLWGPGVLSDVIRVSRCLWQVSHKYCKLTHHCFCSQCIANHLAIRMLTVSLLTDRSFPFLFDSVYCMQCCYLTETSNSEMQFNSVPRAVPWNLAFLPHSIVFCIITINTTVSVNIHQLALVLQCLCFVTVTEFFKQWIKLVCGVSCIIGMQLVSPKRYVDGAYAGCSW